ncbi:hypothetical protein N7G274_004133 [Stereocaulon virgatum]|uniref:C2H2-type domain-containing protein n=1 Tax=Stereocaulon virgatum TaxID=373712 RepID=A0ABR4AI28_9LECA
MTPAFGFSVGDFISAIGLIKKVSKALKHAGGAAADYQNVLVELKALKNVLRHLETLEPTEDNIRHVNAIRGMALACQLPLRDFMVKLERYEASLGPWSERTSFGSAGRKAKWAVSFTEEVEKLRALVAAKHISINLLLATQSTHTLSSMNARTKMEHGDLLSKIGEHRAAMDKIRESVEQVDDRITKEREVLYGRMEAISDKMDAAQLSIIGMRSLGERILEYIKTFPREIRGLLRAIMQNNWQMYQVLLQIQHNTSRAPTAMQASNIRFTNVLGEYRELPYEYFCHWEPFEGFLRAQFKGKPGEAKVNDGRFHIIDATNDSRAIISSNTWSRSISQGTILTMSMIMSHLRRRSGSCPRPGCTGTGTTQCTTSNVLTCQICHLNFFPTSSEFGDDCCQISISEDEEELSQQQVMEDIQTYGSRPPPPEAIDVDEDARLAEMKLPPKRNAAQFKEAVDRPAKVRTKAESKTYNYQAVTTIDWNNSASPIATWLNKSAIPSTAPIVDPQGRSQYLRKDAIAQEIEEIKVFRNVHISTALEPSNVQHTAAFDETVDLELDARIYYRNIIDRYPDLPSYLALRLARANHQRAERLRQLKCISDVPDGIHRDSNSMPPAPKGMVGLSKLMQNDAKAGQQRYKCKACNKSFTRPSSLQTHMYSHNEEKFFACDFEDCGRRFYVGSHLRRHRKAHKSEGSSPYEPFNTTKVDQGEVFVKGTTTIPESDPVESYHLTARTGSAKTTALSRCLSLDEDNQDRHYTFDGPDVSYYSGLTQPQQHSPKLKQMRTVPQVEQRNIHESRTGFWTGGHPPSRRGSVSSCSSSMNSSLHGYPNYDPQEQQPNFLASDSRSSSMDFGDTPRGLPPPPVLLEKGGKRSFECDICGIVLDVDRRLDWQIHVFEDLRPYLCTYEECEDANESYPSWSEFIEHEYWAHECGNKADCVFCGEALPASRTGRGRHIGRHMEEIAFAVVTKPYEAWEFYSDSASDQSLHISPPPSQVHKCQKINLSTGQPCNRVFSRSYDLTRHKNTMHSNGKKMFRCHLCTERKAFSSRGAFVRHNHVVHPRDHIVHPERGAIV